MAAHVFISHKEQDQHLARTVKDLILSRVKKRFKLTVFASSDASGMVGTIWHQFIHRELRGATSMILLYTDPRQVWDWCFYEAGYFAGRHRDVTKVDDLFVFHPRRVPRPAPLQQWQAVVSDARVVDDVLAKIYATSRGSCFDGTPEDRRALAEKIVRAMEAYEPVSILPPLALHLTLEGEPNLPGGDPPFKVIVRLSDELRVRLSLPSSEYELRDFLARSEITEARLAGDMLPKILAELLTNKSVGKQTLPACLIGEQGYRPIIEDASLNLGNKGRVKIGFQRIPANITASDSNAMQVLSEVIHLAVRFRAAIVDQYAPLIDQEGCHDAALPDRSASTQAKPLLHDINAHISEALALGIDSESQLLAAFRGDKHIRLKELVKAWRTGMEQLVHVASDTNANQTDLLDAFAAIRMSNFGYLTESAEELVWLLQGAVQPPPPAPAQNYDATLVKKAWWQDLLGTA